MDLQHVASGKVRQRPLLLHLVGVLALQHLESIRPGAEACSAAKLAAKAHGRGGQSRVRRVQQRVQRCANGRAVYAAHDQLTVIRWRMRFLYSLRLSSSCVGVQGALGGRAPLPGGASAAGVLLLHCLPEARRSLN